MNLDKRDKRNPYHTLSSRAKPKDTFFIKLILLLFCQKFYALNIDSLHIALKKASEKEKSEIQIKISQTYLTSNPDSSYFYAKKALEQSKKIKNDTLIARSHRWLGEWYQGKSKYDASTKQFWEAITLSKKINDKSLESSAYNALAINYYLQNDIQKAEEFIKKAAEIRFEIKDFKYYSVLLSNLAVIHFQNREFNKAIALLRQAEMSLLKQPLGDYMASLYNTLGGCYQMAFPEKDSAVYFYKKSIEVAKKFNIETNLMTGYHNLGEDALRKGKYNEALTYLYQSLEIATKLGNDSYLMTVISTISETYEKNGDYRSALSYQRRALELHKKIFEADKQKIVKDLEFKYETVIKDQKLLEQEEIIQRAKLQAEKDKNKRNLLIFALILIVLFFVFWQIQFKQKRSAKEKFEIEKSKIFENIVHDIRSPLTLIKGPIEVIKKEAPDGKFTESILTIETQSNKLIELVNELLDASKLEKGKYEPVWKIGNPILEVNRILDTYRNTFIEKQIEIRTQIEDLNQNFRYPNDVLEKVFSNLLSNASKFTHKKGTVIIQAKIENHLLIKVFNSGNFIPEAELEKIFERFYRLEQHQYYAGSGIGLSLCKDLITLVRGNIQAENSATGVTFTVKIPLESFETQEHSADKINKPIILVVEDDEQIRYFVKSILSDDFQIIEAENGKIALEMAERELPDIIITDLLMPEMSGNDFVLLLKNNSIVSHIPVVVCSSKSAQSNKVNLLELGAAAYISKPFHPDELKLTLLNLWNHLLNAQKKYESTREAQLPFHERLKFNHDFVNKVLECILDQIENSDYEVNQLANEMNLSRSQLHRKLTQLTGMSATQFIKMIRLEQAKDLLLSGKFNVTETAYKCGFSSQSYFSKSFTDYTGKSPSEYFQQ